MCPSANGKGTCPSFWHRQSAGEVLDPPASIPWVKLAHSPLPAKVYAEACIVDALQWADPDEGVPQVLSFSFKMFSQSDNYIVSC